MPRSSFSELGVTYRACHFLCHEMSITRSTDTFNCTPVQRWSRPTHGAMGRPVLCFPGHISRLRARGCEPRNSAPRACHPHIPQRLPAASVAGFGSWQFAHGRSRCRSSIFLSGAGSGLRTTVSHASCSHLSQKMINLMWSREEKTGSLVARRQVPPQFSCIVIRSFRLPTHPATTLVLAAVSQALPTEVPVPYALAPATARLMAKHGAASTGPRSPASSGCPAPDPRRSPAADRRRGRRG